METQFMNEAGEIFNNLQDLLDDAMCDVPHVECSDALIEDEENTPEFANWIVEGKDFCPACNTKIMDKLPSGVYKMIETREGYKAVTYDINTDELYKFSEDFTTNILDEVKLFWDKKETYKQYNLTHKRGVLLCGQPGSGKTSIINLLVQQIVESDGIVFMISNVPDFRVLIETLKPIVRKIEPDRPIITIIEDVDQLIGDMGGNDYLLLDLMDGKNTIDNHLIILTSNDTSNLSEALLRPSRIDLIYEIPNPNEKIRREYFAKKNVPEDKLDEFAKFTDGMSFAQLKEVFIGTIVQGKSLKKIVKQILDPFKCKNYLGKSKTMKGFN